MRQADMLDFVADNTTTGRREIYRGGLLRAYVRRNALNAPLLKIFRATGPWGTYPGLPSTLHQEPNHVAPTT